MKKFTFLVIVATFAVQFAFAQRSNQAVQRSLTDQYTGTIVESTFSGNSMVNQIQNHLKSPANAGTIWQVTDAAAIANAAKVSSAASQTAAGWTLNNQRLSLYGTTNIPLWEVPLSIVTTEESIDMNEDGTKIANGFSQTIEVYDPSLSVPVWSATVTRSVTGIKITNDGLKVFVAQSNLPAGDSTFLSCYLVGQSTPLWTKSFPGTYASLVINKNHTRLLAGVYGGGYQVVHVLNPADGSLIFDSPLSGQYPPAISDDGKYFVNGNFTGFLYLYEWDESGQTYNQKWSHKVNGTNSWICGMGISGDGSTVAAGTLMFVGSSYDGELYVFDKNNPDPLWVYSGMGDMVQCVDISGNGSVIAAAGWGPFNNKGPDLFLFRKQSSTPYYSINTPGSLFCLDLSDDGKQCVTGGKALHARAFGNGGNLYYINSDPGGGTLSGHAVQSGSNTQTGAKAEVLGLTDYYGLTNDSSAYFIPYIPAGTYSVRYSAIGYMTQVVTGVQIQDGQTAIRDVTLQPVGAPPTGLTASQGAYLYVHLSWNASASQNVTGYKVYRKLYDFQDYPSTPLGNTPVGQLTFNDSTALPLTHYYYTVTAEISDSLQSPYSNDANGWIADGYVTNQINAFVGSTPVIDGVISAGEWNDANRIDLSDFLGMNDNVPDPIGSVTGWFKVNTALTELYVAVENLNDTVLNDHDEIGLYVDDNHDGVFPPPGNNSEGNYWAVHYAAGDSIRYRPIYNNGGVGGVQHIPNAQIKVSGASGHIVYEFVLPLGTDTTWKISYNSQDQSGIFIFALDDPSSFNGWWPCTNSAIFNPAGYGTITFGATDSPPPAPNNLQLFNPIAQNIMLLWEQPDISDFDHFNIYEAVNGSSFTKIDNTIGSQYFLTVVNGNYQFYVTTVDQAGHESTPSNIVTANVVVGLASPSGGISLLKYGPNPFNVQFELDLNLPKQTYLNATVYDFSGRDVALLASEVASSGSHHYSWNGTSHGSQLPAGAYQLVVRTSDGGYLTLRIVKAGNK